MVLLTLAGAQVLGAGAEGPRGLTQVPAGGLGMGTRVGEGRTHPSCHQSYPSGLAASLSIAVALLLTLLSLPDPQGKPICSVLGSIPTYQFLAPSTSLPLPSLASGPVRVAPTPSPS